MFCAGCSGGRETGSDTGGQPEDPAHSRDRPGAALNRAARRHGLSSHPLRCVTPEPDSDGLFSGLMVAQAGCRQSKDASQNSLKQAHVQNTVLGAIWELRMK